MKREIKISLHSVLRTLGVKSSDESTKISVTPDKDPSPTFLRITVENDVEGEDVKEQHVAILSDPPA